LLLEEKKANERRILELESKTKEMKGQLEEKDQKLRECEQTRKKMHNIIQDLRGNIRVMCRVRPPHVNEEVARIEFSPDDKAISVYQSATSVTGKSVAPKKNEFTYDRVFPQTSTQAQVFEEISQLTQSALDGYNVCIFAYGQTGSGKTHTMEGPKLDSTDFNDTAAEENKGMIPRAIEQIFQAANSLKDKGWNYSFQASFLEIYDDAVSDLLATSRLDPKDYEIKHDLNGVTTVTNLTLVNVNSGDQVKALLKRASQNRSVAATKMNNKSSRSHAVFQLKIFGKNDSTNESSKGLLNLIDLAGSERLEQSGATGERQKEAISINTSLSYLGDVFSALANKDIQNKERGHIYRNCKLTYLLQNSLGGNSKTLMLVNISPRQEDMSETLSSLRFATKVNSCQIGVATKNNGKN